jgi:hypothetical protein
LDAWLGEGGKGGGYFRIGATSETLQSIGVKDYTIYWDQNKISKIMKKHPAMTADVIKSVPEVLEHPILVMQSQTVINRITLFGETMDADGKPILAAIELSPQNKRGEVRDFAVIASAYGKNNAQNLVDTSELLYIDPDKKRTNTWLEALRLQLPAGLTKYGSIGTVTYANRDVNGNIAFGDIDGKTAVQEAMEKAMGEKKRYKIGVKGDPSGGAGKTTNPAGFIQNSDLIYLNPDRKRTENWMQSVGLQLPSDATAFGSIGTITYPNGEVKIEGIPYKQHMKPGGQQERYSIKDTEIAAVQNIRRKSLNAFTPEELAATEGFARQYWREMGVKSPFFRSWFGDWRANDTTPVQVAQAEGDTRGVQRNEDTGWEINVSGKVFNETRKHTDSYNKAARPYLPYLNDIMKKAVLLDSYTMGDKTKSGNSLLMHSLYAVADIGKGAEVLKLYVEEMNDPNRADTAKRAYQLQNMEKYQPTGKSSQKSASSISPVAGNIQTIADLFKIVKVKDKNFTPKPASKVMDESGQPMVVYHGTDDTFYEFQYEEIRSREGSFFFALEQRGRRIIFWQRKCDTGICEPSKSN